MMMRATKWWMVLSGTLVMATVFANGGHSRHEEAALVPSSGPYGVAMALMYYAPRDNATIDRIAKAAGVLGGQL